jgi:hypothetical protein
MTMRALGMAAALAMGMTVAGCATGPTTFPVQTTRFHYDPVTSRGTIAVEPLPGAAPASLEFKEYAAAVQAQLLRLGYTAAPPGARAENLATVAYTRTTRPLPPRRSPVQVGIGGGGYSGGWSGGTGVGGGVSFPVGGSGAREGVVTELSVRIRRGPDAIWEGSAQSLTDLSRPGADTPAIAQRLASALFTDFPGESGRTIAVP